MTVKNIFDEFAVVFSKKIDKEYHIKLQFEFVDIFDNNIWQIEVKDGNVFVHNEEKIVPEEKYILTTETLKKLYDNELSPFTAFAKESNEKPAPIENKNIPDEEAYMEKMKHEDEIQFIPRFHKFFEFFSRDKLNKIIIDDKYSRELHGAKAIALYSTGYRRPFFQAFFSIKKDGVFWEPPHECSIFVIRGKGLLKLDNNEYGIKENEYYHLDNMRKKLTIENKEDEPLDILYLGLRE
jgi:hypothetical protein